MRHVTFSCALLLLILAGCATSVGRDPFHSGEPLGVAFSRSGRLAGTAHSLIVTTDGDFTLGQDGRRIRRGTLSDARQATLREHLHAVRWSRVAERYPDESSRDVYAYALSVTAESGATRGVAATDISLQEAPESVRELVGYLSSLLDDLSPR